MAFRFILQPSMAAITATRDGLGDARTERSPYLWTIVRQSEERVALLREGLDATARIILFGLAMDVIYQVMVFKMFVVGVAEKSYPEGELYTLQTPRYRRRSVEVPPSACGKLDDLHLRLHRHRL